MALSYTVLSFICIPILAWLAARTYGLVVNYRQARRLGIPVVVIPFSWQDDWWILLYPYFRYLRHLPVIGYMFVFSYHSWAQDERYRPHQTYGDVFIVVSPEKNEIVVNDPVAAVELQTQYKSWIKPPPLYEIFESFGPNVISINGEDWQRHRRIVNPAFREQNNKVVWEESLRQARQMIGVVTSQADAHRTMLDVRNDCVLIAMHVLSAAGFGHIHDFDGGFREIPQGHQTSLAESLKFLLQNILFCVLFKNIPVLRWIMPAFYRQLTAMTAEFTQYMKEIIAYNRAITQGGGSSSGADIVSALVEADEAAKREQKKAAHGAGAKQMYLSDAELLGNLYIFNLAGFETTANALTYTIPFLAANREIQDWVGEEVDAVLKGRDAEKLDYEVVFPQLVRCLALMYETLRLWGPVPSTERWCVGQPHPFRVKGQEIMAPPETYVSLNLYAVQSDPRWWGENSLRWNPHRWVMVDPATGKESIAPPPPGAAFVPWSVGPRVCPGKKFSQVEFVAIISTLLHECRLKPLIIEGKMKTEEQASSALLEVLGDSMNVITPKMRRPEDAGVVFVRR
ncbi:uncharacterized protein Z520_07414 [Fonsecaea multimorphosa CBS 102226]|uniref:Cytochrome P450 n=1 Tax=Fonsecaea multimorphosa CBS 102226 TaxID=1442371 RepID=A0A0D2H4B9_9EURO|nr:uncharacterized protein Z520_07414 [Fonsecaea multimorphosa CBS 102226]KIX96695.1 hypothetical protein Z520_07414 [Fonsecaea multimorphosa CBS 102226]OAL22750.1 hypothetical protein AYO22_06932 [Fonsecaea multimorphosa]